MWGHGSPGKGRICRRWRKSSECTSMVGRGSAVSVRLRAIGGIADHVGRWAGLIMR